MSDSNLNSSPGNNNGHQTASEFFRDSYGHTFNATVNNVGRDQVHYHMSDTKIQDIRKWISAPDPSTNFVAACNKMTEGTGLWFVNDGNFQEWKNQGGLFWLQGKAGSGKTFLCTTAIKTLKNSGNPVFYFYFDSLDSSQSKTEYEGLVASLLTQIGTHSAYDHTYLESLYKDNQEGHTKVPAHDMKITIQETLKKCPKTQATYIFLDAMDECRNDNPVKSLVQDLLLLQNIHIFVTSRHSGLDLRQAVHTGWNISLDSLGRNEDISVHINKALTSNESFKGLEEEIQAELLKNADGQIRWALKTLPKTLEEIYAHALENIHKDHRDKAKCLLQWILFSYQPLTIKNAMEVLAIDPKKQAVNDYRDDLSENNLYKIISSTIVVITRDDYYGKKVQLAHPSVKEFLSVERESQSSSRIYVEEKLAHEVIAQSCIIYLMHIVQVESVQMVYANFPLRWYAVDYWAMHVEKVENLDGEMTKFVVRFLKFENDLLNEILGWDEQNFLREGYASNKSSDLALYHTCRRGMGKGVIVRLLLTDVGADMNAQGGEYGSVLQAAAYGNNKRIVELLVDAGADVNAQGGRYGNALQAAV
ncbi:hypothetical protein K435DRAFT_867584, partial [Dendrothele bispora CBS 962.96]